MTNRSESKYNWYKGHCWSLSVIELLLLATLTAASAAERLPLNEHYTYERFNAYQGESFRVWGGAGLGHVIELKLEHIETHRLDEKTEQFTLNFSGSIDYLLEKNTYRFEHPQSGEFLLWLEPAATEKTRQWYRADFNQLK